MKLLGIGLDKKYLDEFLSEENDKDFGICNNLLKEITLDQTGVFRGFELLGYEFWSFHTQYCHSNLIAEVLSNLNMKFNENGLFEDLNNAVKVVELIRDHKIGAEPALWQPWAVFEYELK